MMKKLMIVCFFILLASAVFAAPSHPTARPIPAEGVAGNHIITDGYNYFVLVDDVEFISDGGYAGRVIVFFKYRNDGLPIYFQTTEDAEFFVAEVAKRMAIIQPWNNPQPVKPISK
jgi:hypothetical protein